MSQIAAPSLPKPSLFRRALSSASFRLRHFAAQAEDRLRRAEMRALGFQRVGSIPTWTNAEELAALYRLAAQVPAGGCIVEIGSYLGASTCYLAAGSARSDARIICIDTWQNETMPEGQRDTFADFSANTAPAARRLTVIKKRSQDVTPDEIAGQVHLAFVDADHSYAATRADADFILPLMAPEGLVAFHDSTVFQAVSQVVAEVLTDGDWCMAGHVKSMTWLRRSAWWPWPPVVTLDGELSAAR